MWRSKLFLSWLVRRILVSFGNWNISLNLKRGSWSKLHFSLRAWKALALEEDEAFRESGFKKEGLEASVSTSTSMGLSLDDKPVSSSLDLTIEPSFSTPDISHNRWYQFREQCNKGYQSVKTSLNALSLETKRPTWGRWPLEDTRKALRRAEKKETEGHICLILE